MSRKRERKYGIVPVEIQQASGRKRGLPGMGIGAHQEVSAMGHATRTKSRRDKQHQLDRKRKQRGWD